MKKVILLALAGFAIFAGCKSGPKFTKDVAGKDWKLTDVRVEGESTHFSRESLQADGFGEIFTIKFEKERLNGVAAPNRFFAPYTASNDKKIDIGMIGEMQTSTLTSPEKLRENEYFILIQNAHIWDLTNKTFELHSKTEDGKDATLLFVLQ